MEFEVQHLFSIPVIKSKSNYLFEQKEIDFIKNIEKKKNIGNDRSVSDNILENPELKNIKTFIETGIKTYVDAILSPLNQELNFYITQSWTNYTQPGNHHHKHTHPNSLISGCLYINADKDKDTITFYNTSYHRISIPVKNFNPYNSPSWWIPVETGQLILFNSSVEHMVENTKSNDERISIAFNVFVKGHLGDDQGLFGLTI